MAARTFEGKTEIAISSGPAASSRRCLRSGENPDFLTSQIITYIGNKRALLKDIDGQVEFVKSSLGKKRLVCADLFSGSGIVARLLKRSAKKIIANDLETYSYILNDCYLTNAGDFPQKEYAECRSSILKIAKNKKTPGIIAQNYAPQDDQNIQPGERVFYTRQNALLLDTYRYLIEEKCPPELKKFFLAPLITEASVHVNTSGVFKGFYKDKNTGLGCFGGAGKDALKRILGQVELKIPLFSVYDCERELFQEDAEALAQKLRGLDLAYLDPPYNQHPYGSNYFMLNLLAKNKIDAELSPVSGIVQNWNHSQFNKAKLALGSLERIVAALDAKFVVISYNSEGFIGLQEMQAMLKRYGKVKTVEIPYNAFRGSRNLSGRPIHVREYLFVVEKK
ncbi:MAG: DNA adenine methylase [Treponema sp.]|nr:DNA adenine methylase [Treponema sp.]